MNLPNINSLCSYLIAFDHTLHQALPVLANRTSSIFIFTIELAAVLLASCVAAIIYTGLTCVAQDAFSLTDDVSFKYITGPLGALYVLGGIGFMLIVGNFVFFICTTSNHKILQISAMSDASWLAHGLGSFLILAAACSIWPVAALRALRHKRWITFTICVIAAPIVWFGSSTPIVTSVVEATCKATCHATFVASIAQDEANQAKYFRENPCAVSLDCIGVTPPPYPTDQWATNAFVYANYATGICILLLIAIGAAMPLGPRRKAVPKLFVVRN